MEAMQAFLGQQTALLQRMDDMQRKHIAMSDAVLERLSVGVGARWSETAVMQR